MIIFDTQLDHMKCYTIILTCILAGLCATSGQGQQVWTLEECINRAMVESLQVQSSALAEQSSAYDLELAELARYPSLNGNFNFSANYGRTIDPTSNAFINQAFYSNNIGLSSGVLLYNAGRIQKTIEQAEVSLNASVANTESIRYDIALQVANQYLAVLFAKENIRIAESQLALTQEQKLNLDRLIQSGVRAKNDILEFDAQLAQNQQTVLQAKNQVLTAQLGLTQLLRLNESTIDIANEADIDVTLDPDAVTLDQLIESTMRLHPALEAARLNIDAAELGEGIAATAKYPSVTFGGNLGTAYSNSARSIAGFETQLIDQTVVFNNVPAVIQFSQDVPILENSPYFNQLSDNLSVGLGLGVNIPILNNGTARIGVERAKLNVINQTNNYQQSIERIKIELQNALLDARQSKLQYSGATISTQAQTAAFENSKKRYAAGSIGNLEYVTAQNLLQQTQVNEIIAKYDYYFKVTVIDFYLNGLDYFTK